MLRLDFTYDDLGLLSVSEKTRRASVSGVQEKVQLKRVRGGYEIVASGGDAILKPVPRNTVAKFAADIPANEHLTMRNAAKVFGVHTAENELGRCFGVGEAEVRKMMAVFSARTDDVEEEVSNSLLSDAAKTLYLSLFKDRLRALAQ